MPMYIYKLVCMSTHNTHSCMLLYVTDFSVYLTYLFVTRP